MYERGLVLEQDDELAGRVVGLHVGVRDSDLVERIGAVERHCQPPGGDPVEEVLEDGGGEVAGSAAICGEPHPPWQVADWVEVTDDPLVAEHAAEAYHAVKGGRTQCVG
jgi:hypothetical protein